MSTPLVRYVPAPQSLSVGDNAVDLGHPVTRYFVRNRSGAVLYVAADAAATTFSTPVPHSQQLVVDAPAAVLHIYATVTCGLDDLGLAEVEVVGWAPQDAAPVGVPTLIGPFAVDFSDIPHDGDKKDLWTPQVGDVLLRLFLDTQTSIHWDYGSLFIGQNVDGTSSTLPDTFNNPGPANCFATNYQDAFNNIEVIEFNQWDGSGANRHGSSYVFHSVDPVQIQVAQTGGTDPGAGHVSLYAVVSRAVAP